MQKLINKQIYLNIQQPTQQSDKTSNGKMGLEKHLELLFKLRRLKVSIIKP